MYARNVNFEWDGMVESSFGCTSQLNQIERDSIFDYNGCKSNRTVILHIYQYMQSASVERSSKNK